jgi:hypothetical protein
MVIKGATRFMRYYHAQRKELPTKVWSKTSKEIIFGWLKHKGDSHINNILKK